ncbi:hypothetical protein [Mesorhizobium sp. B2-3-4]|uniref:hypothetical protein n=1 Tax=Mesorhizobium sp. B2-3-4 TaxID=2589959 RepID=UPI00112DB505|nr:hypothetical protein [Mesorhizobium sp. B2-3-4]TPM41562.1 hypothetical protein FJ967_01105 [Mesorhizobium sp. B2-3-4]
MSDASWKSEQDRQTLALSESLQQTIDAFGKELSGAGRQPILNAVASALVCVTGAMLASVEDRCIRKELRRVMDRGLSRAIAANEGKQGSAQIVRPGRRADA